MWSQTAFLRLHSLHAEISLDCADRFVDSARDVWVAILFCNNSISGTALFTARGTVTLRVFGFAEKNRLAEGGDKRIFMSFARLVPPQTLERVGG